jgi:phosphatidylglycerol:prolipoprotein diacylglycerol transferase
MKTIRPGDTFKAFMIGYLAFRFFCDFIKPYPALAFGLGAIQWACVAGLLYYSRDLLRWTGLSSDGGS